MHQNMQGSCLLFDMPDGGVALILFYDIQFHETGLAAGFIDLGGQGVASLIAAASNEHARALFGEQPGGRATHATVAAGYQRHLVLKPHRTGSVPIGAYFVTPDFGPLRVCREARARARGAY